eukprot:1572736-Prymnesium_polylepis.1
MALRYSDGKRIEFPQIITIATLSQERSSRPVGSSIRLHQVLPAAPTTNGAAHFAFANTATFPALLGR